MSTTTTLAAMPTLASQAVLLRPRWNTVSPSQRHRWPILVIVLDERPDADEGTQRLFEHLDSGAGPVIPGPQEHHWFVQDSRTSLVGLTLRTSTPIRSSMTVIVPANALAHRPDFLEARTVALTTTRHAHLLTPGFDLRSVLRHLVVVSRLPADLAERPATLHPAPRRPQLLTRIDTRGMATPRLGPS